MIQQILNPEFLLLHIMPMLAMTLGFIALDLTFVSKMREARKAAAERQARP